MEAILQFDQELNIKTFDQVVGTFFRSAGPEVRKSLEGSTLTAALFLPSATPCEADFRAVSGSSESMGKGRSNLGAKRAGREPGRFALRCVALMA